MFVHYFHHQTLKLYKVQEKFRSTRELFDCIRHCLRWSTFLSDDCLIIPSSDLIGSPVLPAFLNELDVLTSADKIFFVGSSADIDSLESQHAAQFGPETCKHIAERSTAKLRLKRYERRFRTRRVSTTSDIRDRWGNDLNGLQKGYNASLTFSEAQLRDARIQLVSNITPSSFENALAQLPGRLEDKAFLWEVIEEFRLFDFETSPAARERFELALAWHWVKGYVSEYRTSIVGRVGRIGYIDCGLLSSDPELVLDLTLYEKALELVGLSNAFHQLSFPELMTILREPRVLLLRDQVIIPLAESFNSIPTSVDRRIELLTISDAIRTKCVGVTSDPANTMRLAADFVARSLEGVLSNSMSETSVDFAIIAIRDDEFRAVSERFVTDGPLKLYPGKNRTYQLCDFIANGSRKYTVAMAQCLEQGPTPAQDLARDMIEDLDPRWILLVGIGGAVPDNEFTLGDVIIAKRLHDFTVGAELEGGRHETVDQGGPMLKKVQDLLALLPAMDKELHGWDNNDVLTHTPTVDLSDANFYGSDGWKVKTRNALTSVFSGGQKNRPPIYSARAMASSGNLIKDTKTVTQWLEHSRDICTIEMELAGVYSAARRMNKEYPILAIRGISDVVGFKRSPEWTTYACKVAAAFAFRLISLGRL